jgi:hypothetical protein
MSSWAELLAWRRERFPAPAWPGLALFVASAAAPSMEPRAVARALALALGLLLQFRLWDDLADRERDARDHPERVLARAGRPRSFRLALLACGACNAALALAAPRPLAALGALTVLTALYLAWYAGLRNRVRSPLAAAHLQLFKYGAFVLVVSGRPLDPGAREALGAALVWLSFCAHELLHDERLRARRPAPAVLALDAALLLAAGALAARAGGGVAAALLAASGVALALAVARAWRGRSPGTLRYAPFVLGLAQALSLVALH